jgi:hypothetical protein
MKDPRERFVALCDLTIVPGCAIWRGGRLFFDGTRQVLPAAFAYTQEHGSVPKHTRFDTTCQTHGCVNPAHVTLADKSAAALQRILAACRVVPGKPGCRTWQYHRAPYFQGAHPETVAKKALSLPEHDALIRSCGTPGCLTPEHLSSAPVSEIYWQYCTPHPLDMLPQQTLQERCVLYNGPEKVGRYDAMQAYCLEVHAELRQRQTCTTPGCRNPNHHESKTRRQNTTAQRAYTDAVFAQALRKAVALKLPAHIARNVARETEEAARANYAALSHVRGRVIVDTFEAAIRAARSEDGQSPGLPRLGDADPDHDLLRGEGASVVQRGAPSDPEPLDSL